MVLDMCVKFGIQQKFGSGDMGSKGSKIEFFDCFSRSKMMLIFGLKEDIGL